MNCVICTIKIREAFGHNPAPLFDDGECCSHCNTYFVIPVRLRRADIEMGERREESKVGT